MVGLYIVYVVYVGVGSWWESRRDEKKRKIREAREEYDATTGLGFDTTRDHLLELGDESQEDEERQFGEGGDIEWEPEEGGKFSFIPFSLSFSLLLSWFSD